jgi:clan AA aspartic protease
VTATLKLTNESDLEAMRAGLLPPDRVRTVELEALVDTGCTMLVLPQDVATRLGLPERGRERVRYADGRDGDIPRVGGLVIEILGRDMDCNALVHPAGTTPLIGQVQLEQLDLVVDSRSRTLAVNPAHPDAPLLDILSAHPTSGAVP